MLALIDNEPVVVQTKGDDKEKFIKSKEFKKISEALATLSKYCEDFVLSAYTKTSGDREAIIFNHAKGDYNSRLYKNRKATHGEKDAKQAERGARLAVHLSNLLFEGEEMYNLNKDDVLKTVKVGLPATDMLLGLTKEKQDEFMKRAQRAESYEEVGDILEEYLPGVAKTLKNNGVFEKAVENATDNAFGKKKHMKGMLRVDSGSDADVDIKKVERTVKLATGAEVKGFKMDDPGCLLPLANMLCDNLDAAAVILGISRMDENGALIPDNFTWLVYHPELEKKIKDDTDEDTMRAILASEMVFRVLGTLSKKYGITKEMWKELIEKEL